MSATVLERQTASPTWTVPALPNVWSILVVTLLVANYFSPFADLDWTWQVRTGGHIVSTGDLRPADAFSYTIAGKDLPDFEWLYEATLYVVWSLFGHGGLKLLRTVLVAAPLLILGLRLRSERVAWHGIALALFTAILIVAPAWNLRPLYVTTICLLLVSWWLHDHCNGKASLPWYLPVIMLLWGNLHPGVITGQALLVGAIVWEWINRAARLNAPLDRSRLWRLTWLGGLGLAATFLSPAPLERLAYPFSANLRHPAQRIFSEMQPLHTFTLESPYTTNLAYVIALLVGAMVVVNFRRFRLWEVALLLGLTALGNLAFRSLQDWVLGMLTLGVPFLAVLPSQFALARRRQPWAARWAGLCGRVEKLILRVDRSAKHILNSPLFRFQWGWIAAALVVLAVPSLIPAVSRAMPFQNGTRWPVAALDWAEAHGVAGNFFGPPDYGSYVGWRLGERGRCYVDTRGFFFSGDLIEDSHLLPQMTPGWRKRFDRVVAARTDYFLLETTGPRGELWRRAQPHVGTPLYLDEKTVLLTTSQLQRCVERLGED
jgi:hypothetical protein